MSVTNVWVGGVTDSSAVVSADVTTSGFTLYTSTNSDMSGETWQGSVTGLNKHEATGLAADTQYYYQVEDGSGNRSPIGQFHTHGPMGSPYSYEFAAFGDAGLTPEYPGATGNELDPNRISNHPAFDLVRNHRPQFVAHLGDMHYYNPGGINPATLAAYRRGYDDILAQPRQYQLYREVPIVHTWDDHEYGPNNSDGTHPEKANAAQVYREREPHYPLAEATGPIYHAFQVGRVLHVVSDVRYNRSPNDDPQSPSKTMLGSAQKSWMDTQLGLTTAEALIWHMSSQWMGTSSDSWNAFRHERDELVTMFGDHGWLGRMCVISADWHGIAIDSGANNAWGGFPVYQFASIDATPSADKDNFDRGASPGRERYGLVRVDDQAGVIRVRGQGFVGNRAVMAYEWFTQTPVTTIPLLSLDYTAGQVHPPFHPTEDDQQIRNDVTAKREGGSSARWRQTEGPLSVNPPPDGVGLYDEQVNVNVAADAQLPDQASWRVHLGTVDEPRYPEVTVNLGKNLDLMNEVARVEAGDLFTVSNPPAWLPRGDIDMIALGYTETIDLSTWEWTVNTAPASPWTVGVAGDEIFGRADTSGSELAPVVVLTNLVTNPSFEVDLSGWRVGAPITATVETTGGTFGTNFAHVETTSTSGFRALFTQLITASGGTTWTFGMDVWDASGNATPFIQRIVAQTPDGEVSSTSQTFTADGTSPEAAARRYFTATLPGDATSFYVAVALQNSTAPAAVDVDAAMVTEGSTLHDYGDGDQPGWEWTGTPHASTSQLTTGALNDATSLSVTVGGALWIDSSAFSGEFPFDIEVGGEVMRVTGISGTASPQTFTVERSVNGVTKSHSAGAAVSLANPAVIAL